MRGLRIRFGRGTNSIFALVVLSVPAGVVLSGLMPIPTGLRTFFIPLFLELGAAVILAIVAIVRGIFLMFHREWGAAIISLFLAFFLALPLLWSQGLCTRAYERTWGTLIHANRFLCFLTLKPEYDRELSSASQDGLVRLFVWYEDAFGGFGVAYDPGARLMRDTARLPGPSTNPTERRGLCGITRFGSGYYYVSFGCEPQASSLGGFKWSF